MAFWFVLIATVELKVTKERSQSEEEFNDSEISPIVHEGLGLVMLPDKILAQSDERIFQSVFMKVFTPEDPDQVCNLECTPVLEKIEEFLTIKTNPCFVEKMQIFKTTIVGKIVTPTITHCFAECLQSTRCFMMSFSSVTGVCYLQNDNLYRVDAIDENLTSKTTLLSCIFDEYNMTRAELCNNGNRLYTKVLSSVKKEHDDMLTGHFQKFEDILASYSLNVTQINRDKRGISWDTFNFLSDIPIVGHFYEILKSPADNKKLKTHLSDLEGRFQKFASTVESGFNSNKKYLEQVLEIVEEKSRLLHEAIQGVKCDVASLSSILIYQQSLEKHKRKIEQMFFATKHGNLKSSIPQTLSLQDLVTVTQNNPLFSDSLFIDHPEVLYRVGDLYLVKAQKHTNFQLFHFLLTTPKLKKGAIFQAYSPVKVPVRKESQNCFILKLEGTIIIKEGIFYEADTTDCSVEDDVIFCQQNFENRFSPSTQRLTCLNGDIDMCELEATECSTTMKYTRGGALIYSEKDILALDRRTTTELTVVSEIGKFSYFFPWSHFSMIQTDRKVIYASDNSITIKRITWKTPQEKVSFDEYLRKRVDDEVDKNITKLKSEIQATNLIVAREYAPNYLGLGVNKNKFLEISSGFSILITVISIVGCCGLCVCRKWKKQSSIMKAVFETVKTERNSKRALRSQRYDLNMEYAPLRPKIIREEIVPVGTTISLEDVIAEEVQPTTAAIEQEEFQPRESTVVDVSTQVYSRKTITRVEHLSIEGNKINACTQTSTERLGLEEMEIGSLVEDDHIHTIGLFD